MRPHAPKETAKSRKAAEVQLLLKARLGWLVGFPSAKQRWTSIPLRGGREVVTLEPRLVRRAAFGLRKLQAERATLTRLVGDAERWLQAVAELLAAVKEIVHAGAAPAPHLLGRGLFPPRLERAVGALPPGPRRAAERLTWVYATEPDLLRRALPWVAAGGGHPDPATAVTLAHLAAQHGAAALTPLEALMAQDPTVPLRGGESVLEPAAKALAAARPVPGLERPEAPPDVLSPHLDALLALEPKAQRRALRLHGTSEIAASVAAWTAWWQRSEALVAAGQRLARSRESLTTVVAKNLALRSRILRHAEAAPPPLDLRTLLAATRSVAEHAELSRATDGLLASWPEAAGPRAAGLTHVAGLAWRVGARRGVDLPRLVARLGRLLPSLPDEAVTPWRVGLLRQLEHGVVWSSLFTNDLVESSFPPARVDLAFDVLESLREDADESFLSVARRVLELVEMLPTSLSSREIRARAASVARQLHARGRFGWLGRGALAALVMLDELGELPDLLEPVLALREDAYELDLGELIGLLLAILGGRPRLLRELVLDGDRGLLAALGQRLALLVRLRRSLPKDVDEDAGEAAWLDDYPAPLQPALAILAETGPRSERIAAQLFRHAAPAAAALERERTALAARIAATEDSRRRSGMTKRLANLEARIAEEVALTPAAIAKLEQKILRRAARERAQAVLAVARRQTQDALRTALEVEELPPFVEDPLTLRVIEAGMGLPAFRPILWQLLRARCGPPPWDLRDLPPNARFLAEQRARGLVLDPWLDGLAVPRSKKGLTLALADDPLDVFLMGHHFGTCLSIGAYNFFSVFANAADINKRVLYGRDAEGRIVGRRLICLSDEGALVAFRPYAHDGSHDFWDASNRYVTALAEAMGATTAPRGPIRCLVAPDWYDDGSVDVAHRFAFLDDGSAFRLRLASIAPDELGALLHHTTGEREVDAILAPMLVALPEVAERPELAMALVGLLRQPAALPGDVAVRLAESLVRAGADSLARRLFVEPIERHLEQTRRQNPWAPQPALDLLARLAPSRTLGLLRRTRHRGVRRWADEPCPHRLLAGARALVALSRPHQARPLLEQVIADPEAEFLHREARRRLVRLTRGEG